jgi:toxin CcdB
VAQFDVRRFEGGFVLDCQSNLLSPIASRLVVPLILRAKAPVPIARLNPAFKIDGEDYVLVTETAAAVRAQQPGPAIASLANRNFGIIDALDVLISGV